MPLNIDPDLWIQQDECCGHIMYTTPNPGEEVYSWENDPSRTFTSQEEAELWHEQNCVELRQFLEKQRSRRSS